MVKRKEQDWPKRLQSHRENCGIASEDLDELVEAYENGSDIQPSLRNLRKELLRMHREATWLHETLCAIPLKKIFSVDRINLTKQEHHLLQAAGIDLFTTKRIGICQVDDFEVYKNCVYENDDMVCFVDPNETPVFERVDKKTGRTQVRIRVAESPEEIDLKHLRPEQKEFFAKYRPDVLHRARKNPSDSVES